MILSKQMKKCKGCGSVLSLNKSEIGYVPKLDKNTTYCYRCFQLKHYNKNISNDLINKTINQNIKKLDVKDKNVFLIIDILDLYSKKLEFEKSYKKLFIIINKMDLFKHTRDLTKIEAAIIKNLDHLNYHYDEIFFVSTKNNSSIKKLNYFIKHLNKNSKNIFIGKTNVGKSSIINALLKLNKLVPNLTTNNALNTTINLQKIKLGYQFMIDTPGVNDQSNLLNWISNDTKKQIGYDKLSATCKNFQIKYAKRIMVENLVIIDVEPQEHCCGTVSFYLNKNLSIITKKIDEHMFNQKTKINYEQELVDYKNHHYDLSLKSNITISGLGLISFKNIKKVTITLHPAIGVYLWNKAII